MNRRSEIVKILIIISSIVLPLMMYFLHRKSKAFQKLFNIIALILAVVFANSITLTVYETLINHAVYSTEIHRILLNPFFLIPGAYLGIFLLYKLLILTIDEA